MKGLEDFQKEYMVFVRGGKYKKKVFNLEVCKYPVTQSMWENIMGYNPSRFKGANKPVEIVNWWEVLKFCNKLSEKYGLEPVYDLSKKGEGVLKVLEHYNIPLNDAYVFGDSMNDFSMFTCGVGNRILLGEHDTALEEYSTYIAKNVLEDGIYLAMKDLGVI